MSSTVKKDRNYIIDIFKLISALGIFIRHVSSCGLGISAVGLLNTAADGSSYFFYNSGPVWGWLNGYLTLSFYCFMAGYWFIDYFKKVQRKGLFGKGKDLTLILRYFCKNYSSYEPMILYGCIAGFLVYAVAFPSLYIENPINIVHTFVTSIPDMLGLGEWVWSPNLWETIWYAPYTEMLTDTSRVLTSFSCIYYLSFTIFALTIYFAIFSISEKFGATIFSFWMYSAYCLTFGTGVGWSVFEQFGIHFDFMRLMGPASLGIWAWYLVDYLKKTEPTKKQMKYMTIANVFCVAVLTWWLFTADGGVVNVDIVGGALCTIVLAERDYITIAVNRFLNKIPISKYINTIAVSIYLNHYQLVTAYGEMYHYVGGPDWLMNLTRDQLISYGILLLLALGIVYIPIEKYLLKPMTKWMMKVTHANDPVFTEEELAAM